MYRQLLYPIVAILLLASVASQCRAVELVYFQTTGNAYIDPINAPLGIITSYSIASDGKFYVDPARTSAFPPPSQTFFVNTTDVISDNDLTLMGTKTFIPLRKLFPEVFQGSQGEFSDIFDGPFGVGLYSPVYTSGICCGGEIPLPVRLALPGEPEPIVPEPGTMAAGLVGCGLGALAYRRGRAWRRVRCDDFHGLLVSRGAGRTPGAAYLCSAAVAKEETRVLGRRRRFSP